MEKFGFLILAAGSSSRLGQPKQLLTIGESTFLTHCIDTAAAVKRGPVLTVLGAYAEQIQQAVTFDRSEVLVNDRWNEGMGTTISVGVEKLTANHPDLNGVLLMVCDQPFLSAALLKELIEMQVACGKPIIASSYGKTLGTPVLFSKACFHLLLQLTGQEGAKKLIYSDMTRVASVSFPGGEIDIDTFEEYDKWRL